MPGFSLSTTHDLWKGTVGYDTARFNPFLSQVSARFTLSPATFRGLAALLTGRTAAPGAPGQAADSGRAPLPVRHYPSYGGLDRLPTTNAPGGHRPFSASVTYDDQRQRVVSDTLALLPGQSGNRTLGLNVGFSPSAGWAVSWDTQYNLTTKQFGQHVLRLDRDLRRWHATFAFVKAPNGNFAFDFFVTLIDQPAIKFQYDQRTVKQ